MTCCRFILAQSSVLEDIHAYRIAFENAIRNGDTTHWSLEMWTRAAAHLQGSQPQVCLPCCAFTPQSLSTTISQSQPQSGWVFDRAVMTHRLWVETVPPSPHSFLLKGAFSFFFQASVPYVQIYLWEKIHRGSLTSISFHAILNQLHGDIFPLFFPTAGIGKWNLPSKQFDVFGRPNKSCDSVCMGVFPGQKLQSHLFSAASKIRIFAVLFLFEATYFFLVCGHVSYWSHSIEHTPPSYMTPLATGWVSPTAGLTQFFVFCRWRYHSWKARLGQAHPITSSPGKCDSNPSQPVSPLSPFSKVGLQSVDGNVLPKILSHFLGRILRFRNSSKIAKNPHSKGGFFCN